MNRSMVSEIAGQCLEINQIFEEKSGEQQADAVNSEMDSLSEEHLENLSSVYEDHIHSFERRFRVREMLISMFSEGAFTDASEWDLLDTHTLVEAPGGPADLLVWKSESGENVTILTLRKIDNATSVYSDIQSLLWHIWDNSESIGEQISVQERSSGTNSTIPIDGSGIEGAIVVANLSAEEATLEFEKRREDSDAPISVWSFNGAENDEVSVVTDGAVDGWNWHVPDNSLGRELRDGEEFAEEYQVGVDYFDDSHHELLFRNLPNYLHATRNRSKKRWYCSREEIIQFLSASYSSPSRSDVEERADHLIQWWQHINALERKSPDEDFYGDDETVLTIKNYHWRKKDPSKFWEEAVIPYRKEVARAIWRANRQMSVLPDNLEESTLENEDSAVDEMEINSMISDADAHSEDFPDLEP